jgi:signal transduction histidine kinase/DNA-binding response OmpR family regulator
MNDNSTLLGASALVVDDTEGNRYTVARLLTDAGMKVREAETVAGAKSTLLEFTPDLVVLDINLPDGSGHEICRAIREDPRTSAVPVMHVSASFITNKDRAYGLEHGADAYLTHPLDPGVFIATARALLRAEGERGRMVQIEHDARRIAELDAARATLLQDLTSALAHTMSAHEVSQVVVTRAFSALGALAGMLTVHVPESDTLRLFGMANVPDDIARRWGELGASIATPTRDATRSMQSVLLDTREGIARTYPQLEREVFSKFAQPPRSLMAAPMIVDRGTNPRVLGALLLLWDSERQVDTATAALITAVADQCALALERARLYEAERTARAAAETARAEAEKANAAKMQFLAVMSHELRTPLNAIGGYAELIELGMYGPVTKEQVNALDRIRTSQQHLLGLINSVLNFAKVEAGRVEYLLESTPVAEAVRNVQSLVAPLASSHGLTLESSVCDESMVVRADTEKLRQVLLNLLSNAIKFTASGGKIVISCTQITIAGTAGRVLIHVTDTGRGIAPTELQQVFDPFVQVGRRLANAEGGSGLGLAISRDLARGMGGDVTATSELGVGSTFTVSLPAA